MKNNEILTDLLNRQLKDVPVEKKLRYTDLKLLCSYVKSIFFDENNCCIWEGYITNSKNESKGIYINFYYMGKKAALHRLLYLNFVGHLDDDEYLKFICPNKGKCCNIHHLQKFKYVTKNEKEKNSKLKNKRKKKVQLSQPAENFTLAFE